MKEIITSYKDADWQCDALPHDGGRVSRLCWRGIELLTAAPEPFRAPEADYGEYENRPVYGYDDCFPSVEPCGFPGRSDPVPDHGACWQLDAHVERPASGLKTLFRSDRYRAIVEREMIFRPELLTWAFAVHNEGNEPLPFQHVMHPLMPPALMTDLALPDFQVLVEEHSGDGPPLSTGGEVSDFLLQAQRGGSWMFLLQNVQDAACTLTLRGGASLTVQWDRDLFPTLGIWWNRRGYPAEAGLERDECAFEPIPGPTSSLEDAFAAGTCLNVAPGETLDWRIAWVFSPTP